MIELVIYDTVSKLFYAGFENKYDILFDELRNCAVFMNEKETEREINFIQSVSEVDDINLVVLYIDDNDITQIKHRAK